MIKYKGRSDDSLRIGYDSCLGREL